MVTEVCNVDGTPAGKHERVVSYGAPRRVYGVRNLGGGLTVATSCADLMHLTQVRASGLDVSYLNALASELPIPGAMQTPYLAVFSVPPGFAITSSGRFPVRLSPSQTTRWAQTGTAPTKVSRALDVAMQHAVGQAKRVAVMGGGGVDSSALFGLVHDMNRNHVQSALFSLCFDGEDSDLPYLDALEAHTGARAHRFTPAESSGRVQDALIMDAQPYLWPTGAWELEAALRAKAWGAEVLLTGAGGDDTFAPWWPNRWWSLPSRKKDRVHAYYTHARRAAAIASRGCLQSAAGIAVREPYVDLELVQTAAGFSAKELEPGGVSRGLLRHLMQRNVPREICHRQSKADFTPALVAGVYDSSAWAYVRELGRGEALRSLGIGAAGILKEWFSKLDAEPTRGELWAKLWPAISVEHFVRQWQAQNPL